MNTTERKTELFVILDKNNKVVDYFEDEREANEAAADLFDNWCVVHLVESTDDR